jgi:hypothetical protein
LYVLSAVADELLNGEQVAVIDDGYDGDTLVLFSDNNNDVTVVQPNEDGSYWRKVVRNKMHRMRETRREKAAKAWIKSEHPNKGDAVRRVVRVRLLCEGPRACVARTSMRHACVRHVDRCSRRVYDTSIKRASHVDEESLTSLEWVPFSHMSDFAATDFPLPI